MTDLQPPYSILDDAARDDLAVRNLDLVPRVIGKLPIATPAGVDREDLLSAGTMGLLTAARTYQPMRGASFRTFAWLAIKGAVLWRVAAPMALANAVGAFVGARLAVKRGDRFVRGVVLGVVLAASAFLTLRRAVP